MKMIKVEKKDNKTRLFACKECGCVFGADKGEYRFATQMEAMHDGIEAVCDCPYCKSTVYKYY